MWSDPYNQQRVDSNFRMAEITSVDCPTENVPPDETGKFKRFFKKYFMQGQHLDESYVQAVKNLPSDAPWHQVLLVKYRRYVGIFIPWFTIQVCWWCLAIRNDYFSNFPGHYVMSLTMIIGAFIGGATSEGGGAVAFPVMTLALALEPKVARDFVYVSQSVGMGVSSFSIIFMKLRLEWHSIIFTSLGGVAGIIFCLEVVDGLLAPAEKKLIFVAVWFSFSFALFLLNRQHKRKTFDEIPDFGTWQAVVLLITGFIGGMFTGFAGSGVDICSTSVLSLLFRVSEKIATPTSIILMATNSFVGLLWRQFMMGGLEDESWVYASVIVPVVITMSPVGALVSSYLHRQVIASFLYVLDTVAIISAVVIIKMTWQYWILTVGLVLGGSLLFWIMMKIGEKLCQKQLAKEKILEKQLENNAFYGKANLALEIGE